MNEIARKVCVVGSGFMGSQIALQCAIHGCDVTLYDSSTEALKKSVSACQQFLDRTIEDGYARASDRAAILDRIRRSESLDRAAADVDLVIEAISENIDIKREMFARLDAICRPETILASNSSSIRISRIESAVQRTELVLNAHFVQPVWKHPFVELMRGSSTSDTTIETVQAFMNSVSILPVLVRRESTGFIFNRIWRAVKKEALRVVDQGIATVEDVDRTWMIQMETPMGPLAMMDVIGLDVIRDIEMIYFEESGDPSDAPPSILLEKIENGDLGVKTGKGFYTYPDPAWQASDFLTSAPK